MSKTKSSHTFNAANKLLTFNKARWKHPGVVSQNCWANFNSSATVRKEKTPFFTFTISYMIIIIGLMWLLKFQCFDTFWGALCVEDFIISATVFFSFFFFFKTVPGLFFLHWQNTGTLPVEYVLDVNQKYYWTARVCRSSSKCETVKTYISSASLPHRSGQLPTQIHDVIRETWRLGSLAHRAVLGLQSDLILPNKLEVQKKKTFHLTEQ